MHNQATACLYPPSLRDRGTSHALAEQTTGTFYLVFACLLPSATKLNSHRFHQSTQSTTTMKTTTFLAAFGFAATICPAPIAPFKALTHALRDGPVNVAHDIPASNQVTGFHRDTTKSTEFELVDKSSSFGISKRTSDIPIEHIDDPAAKAGIQFGNKPGLVHRDAQGTGVGVCGQVNCPETVEWCGKVNCPYKI